MRSRWRLLLLILTASITVSAAREAAESTPRAPMPGNLVLRMQLTTPGVITFNRVQVEWQLENAGKAPVYICQWPGIAFSQHWECPNGLLKGGMPGYPHSRRLDRKYYVELKPGEALVGYGQVDVWPTPSGLLSVSAEFRCDQDGSELGLSAWKGRVRSEWVPVEVPKDELAKACAP